MPHTFAPGVCPVVDEQRASGSSSLPKFVSRTEVACESGLVVLIAAHVPAFGCVTWSVVRITSTASLMLNLVHVLSLEKDLLLSSRPLAQSESVLASPLSSKLAQTLKKPALAVPEK